MADLDDFFAKKDRKKSKTTKKFTTTPEELAKKIEETNIAVKKTEVKPPRKDVVQQPATVGADGAAVEEPVAVEEVISYAYIVSCGLCARVCCGCVCVCLCTI